MGLAHSSIHTCIHDHTHWKEGGREGGREGGKEGVRDVNSLMIFPAFSLFFLVSFGCLKSNMTAFPIRLDLRM